MGASFCPYQTWIRECKTKDAAKRGIPTFRRMESAASFSFPVPLLCLHFRSGERQPALQAAFCLVLVGLALPIFEPALIHTGSGRYPP